MNDLELLPYLRPYQAACNWEALSALKEERNQWIQRPSAQNYQQCLQRIQALQLPEHYTRNFASSAIELGAAGELETASFKPLETIAQNLIPWRKGPFSLFGLEIDAEWRSDYKWERLESKLGNLSNKTILDIGCNNGYFMFRMAAQNPRLVLGIDPVLHNLCQFELLKKLSSLSSLHFELFGVEHVSYFQQMFDTIFSMGIIYHHRHPIQQLLDMREALKPGGQLVLETIGIPGEATVALFPEESYAKMSNVWFVPTLNCLINWAKRARFCEIEVVADTPLTSDEQRLTKWCPPPKQSLADFLNPQNPNATIEGYPAPRRFCIIARKSL